MSEDLPEPRVGPVDLDIEAATFIEALERLHWSVIQIGPIPPGDQGVIEAARIEARAVAETAGRGQALTRAQRRIADWTLSKYQRAGFGAAYLSGWLDEPAQRLEVATILVDAVTAYALRDLLSDETATTLVGQFDVSYGGPIFRASPEESGSAMGEPLQQAPVDGI